MSEKTLGQVLYEAQWPKSNYGAVDKTSCIREAAGIAAVACYIIDERIAKHVSEYHANELSDDEAKTLRSLPVAHEHGVSRDPPKPEAASEAGDWVMDIVDAGWRSGSDLAAKIREAAERHYGLRIIALQGYLLALADAVGASYPSPMIDATLAANVMAATIKTIQERDAAVAECERLRAMAGVGVEGCDGGGCDDCCPGMPSEHGLPKTCPLD